MLPNFIIIGAAKAASTWLSDCLGEHPDVFMADIKEVRFFTRYYDQGLDWYQTHFSDWNGQKAVGEATPGYLGNDHAPARIRQTLGEVPLILSMRHPVDRAYSAFWHFTSHGAIPLGEDFEEHFEAHLQKAGHYIRHIKHYLEYFPREKLLILVYEEDVRGDPFSGVRQCFEHVGVDPTFIPQRVTRRSNKAKEITILHEKSYRLRNILRSLPHFIERPLVNIGKEAVKLAPKKQTSYRPLDPNLRQELYNGFYRDEVKELEDFLQRDLSIWYNS